MFAPGLETVQGQHNHEMENLAYARQMMQSEQMQIAASNQFEVF